MSGEGNSESSRCNGSRITLGSSTETFLSLPLDWYVHGDVFVWAIQEDKWIPGNILATIGSALYTVTPKGDAELLAGSLQIRGYRNGVGAGALFNVTSGMLQMDDGKTVIISDLHNYCLRKVDRATNTVSVFAGKCNLSYIDWRTNSIVCPPHSDGSLLTATFCNPLSMRYVNSTNKVYLLDLEPSQTHIRSINLETSSVRTEFTNSAFESRDFLIDEKNEDMTYIFAVTPGILKIDASTSKGEWLAGCRNLTYPASCSNSNLLRNQMVPKSSHAIFSRDGLYFLSDHLGHQVYIIDPTNSASTKLCPSYTSYCSTLGPRALTVIGDYLYIGESIKPNYQYHNIKIKRIKLSISSQSDYEASSSEWLLREKTEATRRTTNYEASSSEWLLREKTEATRRTTKYEASSSAWLVREKTEATRRTTTSDSYYGIWQRHTYSRDMVTYHYNGDKSADSYDYTGSGTKSDDSGNSAGMIGGLVGGMTIFIIAISFGVSRCTRRRPLRLLNVNARGITANGRSSYNRVQQNYIVDTARPATSAAVEVFGGNGSERPEAVNLANVNEEDMARPPPILRPSPIMSPPPYEEHRKVDGSDPPPAYDDTTSTATASLPDSSC